MAVSIVLDRPGGRPLDLVAAGWNAVRYSTTVSGGFGAATLVAPADARKLVPLLGVVRIMNDDRILWEGLVEDKDYSQDASARSTTITAFGKQRLLQLASVKRMWSLRALQIEAVLAGSFPREPNLEVRTGFLDIANPTRKGVRIGGRGLSVAFGAASGASVIIPAGSQPLALFGDVTHSGSVNLGGVIQAYDSAGAAPWAQYPSDGTIIASSSFTYDLTTVPSSIAAAIALVGACSSTTTFTTSDYTDFSNLRLLGTSITEDVPGGYYAVTLLRDVLRFVPGITAGEIETGLEYIVQELDRSTRTNVRSVIDEVVSYFTREWAVWEDGRFDWKQPNLSEPGWVIPLADTVSCRIKETVDGLARDTYLTFTDPADQRQKEAVAQTTRLGNAFYRNGLVSDDLQAPGLAFTPISGALYAQAANLRNSRIPAAQGSVVVNAWTPLRRSSGSMVPALEIRAGENVTIPDFPTDDAFSAGQDNQTLFHVVQVDVDLSAATVTLTIAGYLPGLDVLTARLTAATKVASS